MDRRIVGIGLALVAVATGVIGFGSNAPRAQASSVIDQWTQVKAPAPPEVKPVTLDAKTTALLVLDFTGTQDPSKGPCSNTRTPRCVATIPAVKGLLAKARAAGVYVIYSVSPIGTAADIATDLKPEASDPVVSSQADKFVKTKLGELLTGKGIKTVVLTGTVSEGAVMNTGIEAIFNYGQNVVIAMDGISSPNPYAEQYVAWHFANAPVVSAKSTLSTTDQISFK